MLGLAYGISSGIAQAFKHLVFNSATRPKRYFEDAGIDGLFFIEGVEVHSFNSMPSGHTATAFCIFCLLALLVTKKWWGFGFALLAILAGFSRVYLNQHFLEDIFVGAFIGLFTATLVYWTLNKKGEIGILSGSLLNSR